MGCTNGVSFNHHLITNHLRIILTTLIANIKCEIILIGFSWPAVKCFSSALAQSKHWRKLSRGTRLVDHSNKRLKHVSSLHTGPQRFKIGGVQVWTLARVTSSDSGVGFHVVLQLWVQLHSPYWCKIWTCEHVTLWSQGKKITKLIAPQLPQSYVVFCLPLVWRSIYFLTDRCSKLRQVWLCRWLAWVKGPTEPQMRGGS